MNEFKDLLGIIASIALEYNTLIPLLAIASIPLIALLFSKKGKS